MPGEERGTVLLRRGKKGRSGGEFCKTAGAGGVKKGDRRGTSWSPRKEGWNWVQSFSSKAEGTIPARGGKGEQQLLWGKRANAQGPENI